jgi:murein DD-endopeptidase MepM/ murein hydrolase activator NlpD
MGEKGVSARMRSVLRLTAAGVTAAFLGGCSSDVSRLATGPFGPADNTPTASIGSRTLTPPEAIGGAPAIAANSAGSWGAPQAPSSASIIQSAPLAPLTPPAATAAVSRPAAQAVTSAASNAARTAGGSFGPWTTAGGAAITVAQGESASVIASRYGVPMEALIKANGLSSASQVTPGKSLIVPVYNAAARQASAVAPAPAATAAVAPVRTAARTASTTAASAAAAPAASTLARPAGAAASRATPTTARSVADTARPVAASAAAPAKPLPARVAEAPRKPEQKPAAAAEASKQRAADAGNAGNRDAARAERAKPKEVTQKPKEVAQKPAEPERQQTAAAPAAAQEKPEFRWPARGRIIQGFKSGANDGISIAVPEGTAVKAAEGGVVAYAGNELKGYGNLVLIRHPNGFVSAYAHNGAINVKRGETVKRGQTIAKSGQSGNVAAPQLHFELRKGSTPVDPTQYLAGI